jgi:MerR family regulatory protein
MDGRTVGQVAEATGVTVRALHHSDEIGLLVLSGRSAAGYRLETMVEATMVEVSLSAEEMFSVFGRHDMNEHAQEAHERWGDTDAYRESARRVRRYGTDEWRPSKDCRRTHQRRASGRSDTANTSTGGSTRARPRCISAWPTSDHEASRYNYSR